MALTDQLEHYWTLNETSGNRADSYGSLPLSPTNTVSYADGTYSNGALFAAAGKLATASVPTALNGAAYSVSVWWKFGASLGTDVILSSYQSVPAEGFLLFYLDSGGGVVSMRASHAVSNAGATCSGNVTIGTGWHHFVVTYSDADNTIALYHDGALLDSQTITEGASSQPTAFSVCRDENVYGTADEIGIWSRALSAAEVAQLRVTRTLDPSYAVVPGMKIERIVEEDLNVGTGMTWVTNPGGGELRVTQLGLHSVARGQKEYTATWSPGAITAGSKASTTVTVPDAAVGDFVIASHDKMLTNGLRISGHVSAAGTAKVVMHNPTAASITPASGTVSVLVFPSIQSAAYVPVTTGSVSGTITSTLGSPIDGATVQIIAQSLSTTSGLDGTYSFATVTPGSVTVNASRSGYGPNSNTGTVTAGNNTVIDVVLSVL